LGEHLNSCEPITYQVGLPQLCNGMNQGRGGEGRDVRVRVRNDERQRRYRVHRHLREDRRAAQNRIGRAPAGGARSSGGRVLVQTLKEWREVSENTDGTKLCEKLERLSLTIPFFL